MRILPVKSKKGLTLVETVIAVVVLSILAAGVLTMLGVGGKQIAKNRQASVAHAEATQIMDRVVSAISNGGEYIVIGAEEGVVETLQPLALDLAVLKTTLGLGDEVAITATVSCYAGTTEVVSNVRGWYLTLTYKGQIVKAFASNTRGVFD